ncbi:MAG: DUF2188 domain-containing protein [Alphaproteobacteria bacterium]|nr:DUF2188 domain-containing protein [Alphaproteobacteria bacterium]
MPKNDRFVAPRPGGKWANQRTGATKATSLHNTQQEAEQAARQAIGESGGGRLTVCGADGRVKRTEAVPASRRRPPTT